MPIDSHSVQTVSRPYCAVGAGRLTSFIWKSGDSVSGWMYRFNLFRSSPKGSRVTQLYRVRDILDLVKLAQVLATVILDDGCISVEERRCLRQLARQLSDLTETGLEDDSKTQMVDDGHERT